MFRTAILVRPFDLDVLDQPLVLGREVLGEGLRRLVHVVVGVEDRESRAVEDGMGCGSSLSLAASASLRTARERRLHLRLHPFPAPGTRARHAGEIMSWTSPAYCSTSMDAFRRWRRGRWQASTPTIGGPAGPGRQLDCLADLASGPGPGPPRAGTARDAAAIVGIGRLCPGASAWSLTRPTPVTGTPRRGSCRRPPGRARHAARLPLRRRSTDARHALRPLPRRPGPRRRPALGPSGHARCPSGQHRRRLLAACGASRRTSAAYSLADQLGTCAVISPRVVAG